MSLEANDPMPFGKFKGEPMEDLPASYLHWCWHNVRHEGVISYINDNISALMKETPDLIWEEIPDVKDPIPTQAPRPEDPNKVHEARDDESFAFKFFKEFPSGEVMIYQNVEITSSCGPLKKGYKAGVLIVDTANKECIAFQVTTGDTPIGKRFKYKPKR